MRTLLVYTHPLMIAAALLGLALALLVAAALVLALLTAVYLAAVYVLVRSVADAYARAGCAREQGSSPPEPEPPLPAPSPRLLLGLDEHGRVELGLSDTFDDWFAGVRRDYAAPPEANLARLPAPLNESKRAIKVERDWRLAEAARLVAQGLKIAEAAKRCGVAASTLRGRLRKKP